MKYTIASGNPFDGIDLAGVFDSHDEAVAVAEVEYDNQSWWIAEIQKIEGVI